MHKIFQAIYVIIKMCVIRYDIAWYDISFVKIISNFVLIKVRRLRRMQYFVILNCKQFLQIAIMYQPKYTNFTWSCYPCAVPISIEFEIQWIIAML